MWKFCKIKKNPTFHTLTAGQKHLEDWPFWPTPCLKRGTFGRSGFSAEGTLISAAVVSYHGRVGAQSTPNCQNANLYSSNFLSTADDENMTKWLSHKDRRRICTCLLVSVLGTLALLIPRFSSWWPPGWAETGASASPSPEQITSTSNANSTDRHTPMKFWVLRNLGNRHQIHKQADLVRFLVWRSAHTHTYYFTLVWRPPHLEQSPPRHQALCYSLFLQKSTQDISLLRIFQLNHIVLHSHQSVQCVCVRASSA